jgi:hypothetical protein
MAGVPARSVLAALLAGVLAGSPASGSDKEARLALSDRSELARDRTFISFKSKSQTIEDCKQRVSGIAARSSVLRA